VTCEVAVMNKHGVALAADSAVSLCEGKKVYHTAEKLFQLSNAPIAIMTYGCAEIMGVPWEIVIKSYIQQFGERRFPTVEQYAQDFLRFIEGAETLFPGPVQQEWFRSVVESYWKGNLRDPWLKKLNGEPKKHDHKAATTLLQIIKEEIAGFQKIPPIENLGHAFGEKVISDYSATLEELANGVFHNVQLTDEIRDALKFIVKLMHTQQWFHVDHFGGIVVAGIGEVEPFPALYIYNIGTIAVSRLRYVKADEAHVDRKQPVIVIPFAQTDMIDLFCSGIYPALKERLIEIIAQCLPHAKKTKSSQQQAEAIEQEVRKILEKEFQEKYTQPLISSVDALSRHDLAKMAEALVSLTAFKARMSVEQQETVGGPIDVAVISKGEGYVWVKRKDPIKQEEAAAGLSIS